MNKAILNIKIQHKEIYPNGEWRLITNLRAKSKGNDDEIYFYVDDDVDLDKLKIGQKIMLDEEFTIIDIE